MRDQVKRLAGAALSVALVFICQTCGPKPTGPTEKGLAFTLIGADSKAVASGDAAQFIVTVKNNGPSPVVLTYIKKALALPADDWSASLCIGGSCLPPAIDSVDSDVPIPVNGTDTCSVDVTTGAAGGSAQVNLKMYSKADPSQSFEHTFSCSVP